MFFEFARGDLVRMIDDSGNALSFDERFENALRNTAMAWRQGLDRRLRRLGVSLMRWMTIAAATQARSPMSQSQLADTLAVSRASMVHTIDRLVKDGHVKRKSSASDRRLFIHGDARTGSPRGKARAVGVHASSAGPSAPERTEGSHRSPCLVGMRGGELISGGQQITIGVQHFYQGEHATFIRGLRLVASSSQGGNLPHEDLAF